MLSKFAWVHPLKDKTGAKVVEAFEEIVSQGRQPNRRQTDKGKEFYNRSFENWTKDRGIQHFSTRGDAKASVVERFNRTLKQRLYRYFTSANTSVWQTIESQKETFFVESGRPRSFEQDSSHLW